MKKNKIIHEAVTLILVLVLCTSSYAQKVKELSPEKVINVMKKSSDYMANKVSTHGGYLWNYNEELTEYYGEVPARSSQIWVQGSGTPAMGELFLNMYKTTGESCFLDYSKKAADALIYGQHPLGGWHYVIDFDKPGMEKWYKDTASQFLVGWEEYRHYYGNCTYDDDVTQGATRFLLHLYNETHDPTYMPALRKALHFMLVSQYPNGGWPQRYPLRYEFAHDGFPDYTSYYTLNDNAMNSIIDVLLEAYEILGNEEYLEAAKRGGDFFMIAQGPIGKAGWTDQYDMNIQPVAARTHEPASFQIRYTKSTITELEKLFLFTGDRRYLRPIPAALDWMESVIIGVDEKSGNPEYAKWYDPKTNYPIIRELIPEVTNEGYMKYKYTVDTTATYINYEGKLPFRERYEKISDIEPEKAHKLYNEMNNRRNHRGNTPSNSELLKLINSMDKKGIWIETFKVHDMEHTMDQNFESVFKNGMYLYAVKEVKGISTRTFIRNMSTMIDYLKK